MILQIYFSDLRNYEAERMKRGWPRERLKRRRWQNLRLIEMRQEAARVMWAWAVEWTVGPLPERTWEEAGVWPIPPLHL